MDSLQALERHASERWKPYVLALVPTIILVLFFAAPMVYHLSTSLFRSSDGVVSDELTLGNFATVFGSPYLRSVMVRTFAIGLTVGALVVTLSFPLAYFLARTSSRHKDLLLALCFAPLLSSVTIRTYGWYTILSPQGIVNNTLQALGLTSEPIIFLPSVFAVILGFTHVLLPYGTLTILGSLQAINPNLERAAMNLGANRTVTFVRILLPLALPGMLGGFCLTFAITLSAYATPAILGGPRSETMATMIYSYMNVVFDWSMGATLGVILIVSSLTLLFLASRYSVRRARI